MMKVVVNVRFVLGEKCENEQSKRKVQLWSSDDCPHWWHGRNIYRLSSSSSSSLRALSG